MIVKDEYGWSIGKWNTPVSVRWINNLKLKSYELQFHCKYWEVHLKRLKVRVWKPKFMRCFRCN